MFGYEDEQKKVIPVAGDEITEQEDEWEEDEEFVARRPLPRRPNRKVAPKARTRHLFDEDEDIYGEIPSARDNAIKELLNDEIEGLIDNLYVFQGMDLSVDMIEEDIHCFVMNETYYVMINHVIVGHRSLEDEDLAELLESISVEELGERIRSSILKRGILKGLEKYDLYIPTLSGWWNGYLKHPLDELGNKICTDLQVLEQKQKKMYRHLLSVAAVGSVENIFENDAVLLAKLVTALENAGDCEAEDRVAYIFRKYVGEYMKTMFDLAGKMVEYGER